MAAETITDDNFEDAVAGDKPVVVFCTTENDMAHITEALRAGADEYVMKPFDGEIIESKLQQTGLLRAS